MTLPYTSCWNWKQQAGKPGILPNHPPQHFRVLSWLKLESNWYNTWPNVWYRSQEDTMKYTWISWFIFYIIIYIILHTCPSDAMDLSRARLAQLSGSPDHGSKSIRNMLWEMMRNVTFEQQQSLPRMNNDGFNEVVPGRWQVQNENLSRMTWQIFTTEYDAIWSKMMWHTPCRAMMRRMNGLPVYLALMHHPKDWPRAIAGLEERELRWAGSWGYIEVLEKSKKLQSWVHGWLHHFAEAFLMAIAKVLMTYFRRYITDFKPKIASENCHRIHAKWKLCELCECSSMECKTSCILHWASDAFCTEPWPSWSKASKAPESCGSGLQSIATACVCYLECHRMQFLCFFNLRGASTAPVLHFLYTILLIPDFLWLDCLPGSHCRDDLFFPENRNSGTQSMTLRGSPSCTLAYSCEP